MTNNLSRVSKTDVYMLDFLVSDGVFSSVFAARYVMERCAWDFQEIGKFLSWAEVYRDWKIHLMPKDQDGKRIFSLPSKEATARAIKNTNNEGESMTLDEFYDNLSPEEIALIARYIQITEEQGQECKRDHILDGIGGTNPRCPDCGKDLLIHA